MHRNICCCTYTCMMLIANVWCRKLHSDHIVSIYAPFCLVCLASQSNASQLAMSMAFYNFNQFHHHHHHHHHHHQNHHNTKCWKLLKDFVIVVVSLDQHASTFITALASCHHWASLLHDAAAQRGTLLEKKHVFLVAQWLTGAKRRESGVLGWLWKLLWIIPPSPI